MTEWLLMWILARPLRLEEQRRQFTGSLRWKEVDIDIYIFLHLQQHIEAPKHARIIFVFC